MRFYLERTARAIFTVWMAMTLAFALIRLIPSGPIEQLYQQLRFNHPNWAESRIRDAVADRAARMGLNLDAPLWKQYVDYLVGVLQGDLGMSFHYTEPVAQLVGEALPWTLFYVTVATTLVFLIAVVWGSITAYKEGSAFDTASSSLGIVMSSFPFYVLAFLLIMVFGYTLGWLPVSGRKGDFLQAGLNPEFLVSAVKHAILPILAIVLSQYGLNMLGMRGNSIQVLGEDYVRVARLRGLADTRIATRYVARNAILPMYTSFLTLIGFNLGASIILEQVFSYQGIGYYMFVGLEQRDYALVMGTFLVYAVALVLAVYVADLTYSKVDPRVKQGEHSESY